MKMLKKSGLAFLITILAASQSQSAGPRAWGKSGTATNVSAQLSVKDTDGNTFTPASFCFTNSSTTVDFYINWKSGVAVAADDGSNIKVLAGTTVCFTTGATTTVGPYLIGIITAASTAAYNAFAIAKS